MQDADRLVDIARQYRDNLGWELVFLTAIPHNNDMPWTFWDKVEWTRQYYPDIPVWFGPYSEDKHLRVRVAGDILVDDRLDNCTAWTGAGGLAFKVAQRADAVGEVCDKLLIDYSGRLR
jgi:5'(3')-deoxyribonucleotidase